MQYVFGILMTLTALFLILLVLIQRGRGGGLAGAFGGMGGQSAFGTKAGDTFTKITVGASIFWLVLCIASVRFLGHDTGPLGAQTVPSAPQVAPVGSSESLLGTEGAAGEGLDPAANALEGSSDEAADSESVDSAVDDPGAGVLDDAPASTEAAVDGDAAGEQAELSQDADPAVLEAVTQPPNE